MTMTQNNHLRITLLAAMLLTVVAASAQEYMNAGNLRYKIQDSFNQELRVTFPDEPDYETEDLVIPATIKTKQGVVWTVTSIGDQAFSSSPSHSGRGYQVLRSITLPKTIKSIHINAFLNSHVEKITADCPIEIPFVPIIKQLKEFHLGANATIETCHRIGGHSDGLNLEKVTLNPANKTLIMENGALYDRAKTQLIYFAKDRAGDYVMPTTVQKTPYRVFSGNTVITNITIGTKVTSIDDRMFENCSSLQSVKILGPVTEIRERTFVGCNALQQVSLPASIKHIGKEAFYKCSNLQSITIPGTVTEIMERTFYDCKSLRQVNLSSGLVTIGKEAFAGCEFKTINIPSTVKVIKLDAFSYNTSLKKLTFPENIEEIEGLCVARRCVNLESIVFPKKLPVKTVREEAFLGDASLKEIVFPEAITNMSYRVFAECKNLQHVYFCNPKVLGYNRSCEGGPRLAFHVRQGLREEYIKSGWSYFANDILEDIDANGVIAGTGNGTSQTISATSESTVHETVFQMPTFLGGDNAMNQFIANNLKYPLVCEENDIQGRVICSFIVETVGSIGGLTVAKSAHPALDKEALRIIKAMPKWIPGKLKDGTHVRVKYNVPITFRLQ